PLGNDALEAAIGHRVVLGADRQPLFAGIERGPLGNGPADQHAVDLEAEIVVQAGSIVLLHDKLRRARAAPGDGAPGFGRLLEVALGVVGRDTGHEILRHGKRRRAGLVSRPLPQGLAGSTALKRSARRWPRLSRTWR